MRPRLGSSPRRSLALWGLAAGGALALARARRPSLRVTRRSVPWPELGRPLRVAQLSDVHLGWSTPQVLLDEVVEAAHAAGPDLVVLTGDYVNHGLGSLRQLEALVGRLPGRVLAVLGNHDHWAGAEAIQSALERGGAEVLRNRAVEVLGLTVVGVDDGFTGHADVSAAFDGVQDPRATLVLTHYPPSFERIAPVGGRLVLAGHTHGGQIDLPWGATARLARLGGLGRYLRGEFRLDGARMYVNAGLGHAHVGMRRGELCRPEMALFELQPPQ